jgi:hypothetical protein
MATELANLRRTRSRCHFRLKHTEMVVEDYAFRLAQIEGRIQELSPELNLLPHFYTPNPHFARNKLPGLAIAILREANKPLATREIAMRALAAKGVVYPDRRAFKVTRTRLVQFLSKLDARGMTRKVGQGKATRQALIR